ncbi:MAG: hypothetical protein RL732_1195 [Bacteroidota bacterium]
MRRYAVIVAGGSGLRMGSALPKQFLDLRGKPVLWYTLRAFLEALPDLDIILVVHPAHRAVAAEVIQLTGMANRITTTDGGETRFHSVKNGLLHIQEHSIIFVHDGVRCLPSPELIKRCYVEALDKGNAIPAIPAVDSIRIETALGNAPFDRNKVRIIQTPQTFYSDILKAAFEQDYEDSFTDEASVVERLGVKIHLVEGESSNIKITRPLDLVIAERILEEREMGIS